MKNKHILLPTLIFVTTLIIGLLAIIVTEQFQQKKITTTPRAQVACNTPECPDEVKRMVVDCSINGAPGRQECDVTFSYAQDPVCGRCVGCGRPEPAPQNNCSPCIPDTTPTPPPDDRIPPPENTPTLSPTTVPSSATPSPTNPAATRTPTPSVTQPAASVTPSRTPTPSVTTPPPPPTHSPTPSPSPIPHACGYSPCDSSSNQCTSGLICVKASDNKYYCAQPAYEAACKTSPSVSSCCNAPTNTPTPGPTSTPAQQTCGYTQCDNAHPCQAGLECVTAKNDKSYCSKPENKEACRNNNGDYSACCGGPTPTRTALVQNSPQPSNTAAAPTIPSAGVPAAWFFVAAPLLLVVLGLMF